VPRRSCPDQTRHAAHVAGRERRDIDNRTPVRALDVGEGRPDKGQGCHQTSIVQLQDWILTIGIALIFLFAFAEITDPKRWYDKDGGARNEGTQSGAGLAVANWVCIVYFLDWRRGLADLGLPEAASWALAPIGLILVIAVSFAAWEAAFGAQTYQMNFRRTDQSRWRWIGLPLLWLAAWAGYVTVLALRRT